MKWLSEVGEAAYRTAGALSLILAAALLLGPISDRETFAVTCAAIFFGTLIGPTLCDIAGHVILVFLCAIVIVLGIIGYGVYWALRLFAKMSYRLGKRGA